MVVALVELDIAAQAGCVGRPRRSRRHEEVFSAVDWSSLLVDVQLDRHLQDRQSQRLRSIDLLFGCFSTASSLPRRRRRNYTRFRESLLNRRYPGC